MAIDLMAAGGASNDVTATAGDILSGKTANNSDGDVITGTLALSGNAGTGDVLSGKTFYTTDPKSKATGTMTNNGTWNKSINPGDSVTIPAGYHSGGGWVKANNEVQWNADLYLILCIQFQGGYANGYIPEHTAVRMNRGKTTEPQFSYFSSMAGNIANQSNVCYAGLLKITTEWGNYKYANCQALTNIYDCINGKSYPSGTVMHLYTGVYCFRKN